MKLRTLFVALADPRLPRTRRYPLVDILLIVLCGLLSGADNFVEIAKWAFFKRQWLAERLGIVRIPSHDTLGRVLAKLDSQELNQALGQLSQLLSATLPPPEMDAPPVIALDGKRLKGALDNLNLVSAWASHAQMTLAVQAVPEDTNEIPVVQALLRLIDVKNSVVTADALHCQRETAQIIVERGGDYALCLKKNQATLWNQSEDYFNRIVPEMGYKLASAQTLEKAHGQWIEVRRCRLTRDTGWFDPGNRWSGLASVAQIEWVRRKGDEVRVLRRYFLTSLSDPTQVLRCARMHWGIENGQHWRLDVFYREDDSRVRARQAATNLAMMRRMSLSMVKRDTSEKVGVQTRRRMAGWDDAYRERLLATAQVL